MAGVVRATNACQVFKFKSEKKVYQLRVSNNIVGRKIMYKGITCWCSNCVIGSSESCLEGSAWTTVNLEEVVRRKRARNEKDHSAANAIAGESSESNDDAQGTHETSR